MNDFKNNVIEKIKTGAVAMRPRWYFILRTALTVVGMIMAALFAVYFLSFVIFTLHRTGVWFTPGFGVRGLILFLVSSPWILIGIVGIFLSLLYILVIRYSFSYHRPFLYSLLGITSFIVLSSFMIQLTPMHENLQSFSERTRMPGMNSLYSTIANKRPANLTFGTITQITDTGFILKTDTGEILSVVIGSETKLPRKVPLDLDVHVFVHGKREGDSIFAYGVRPVSGDFSLPRRGNGHMQEGQIIRPFMNMDHMEGRQ